MTKVRIEDAPVRIESETVASKIVQKFKYRDCEVAKVPDSAPVKLVRLYHLKLTIVASKRFLKLITMMLICSPVFTVKAGTSASHLRLKLLMTIAILLSFFTKTKFDNLWKRVFLRRCSEHLVLDDYVR